MKAAPKDQIEWDRWYCPHPDCEEGRGYVDPESITETVCDRNHPIKLVWREGSVSPRLMERLSRHRWRPFPHIGSPSTWVCIHCLDRSARKRLPVFGCVGVTEHQKIV
jgi:hypothetical protein